MTIEKKILFINTKTKMELNLQEKKPRIFKCKNQHILFQKPKNQARLAWFKSLYFFNIYTQK